MTMGLMMTLLTGLAWCGVGAAFSAIVGRKLDFAGAMLASSLVCAAASAMFIPDHRALLEGQASRTMPLFIVMTGVAVLGSLGFLSMRRAMERGPHGLAWAVCQSAMVGPFMFATLFLGEETSFAKIAGMSIILAGLAAFAASSAKGGGKGAWFAWALLACALVGASQILSVVPSHWAGWADSARLRVPMLFLSTAAVWAVVAAVSGGRRELARALPLAALHALLVLAGQTTLYAALDMMSEAGMSSLVYPLAIGVCVAAFCVYSRVVLGERNGTLEKFGVAAAVAGALTMSI